MVKKQTRYNSKTMPFKLALKIPTNSIIVWNEADVVLLYKKKIKINLENCECFKEK